VLTADDAPPHCRWRYPLLFLQHMISKFEPVLPDQEKYGSPPP
jgi:hypothetical protein